MKKLILLIFTITILVAGFKDFFISEALVESPLVAEEGLMSYTEPKACNGYNGDAVPDYIEH